MKHLLLLILIISCCFPYPSHARSDTAAAHSRFSNSLRISVLTCGTGDELYASFGHTGIRVQDTIKGIDEVYNYGTFNFSDPDFYTKFTLGKLLYYIDKSSFDDFMSTYYYEKRTVDEQELLLRLPEKIKIVDYLENNLLPENRDYLYDFLYDNCATRIRDVFPETLGPAFHYGDILGDRKISFRIVINQYLFQKHWERLGINLLLGSPVDADMSDSTSMFLPDFLYKGLEKATYHGNNITMPNRALIEKVHVPAKPGLNTPFWVFTAVLALLMLSYFITALNWLKPILNGLLLFITGALGCFMLFMWLGTNHKACNENWNVLWALPFNIIIAFIAHRKMPFLRLYALAAITLLIVALILNIIGMQQLPLLEIIPLLAALTFIYIDMYKRNMPAPKPA